MKFLLIIFIVPVLWLANLAIQFPYAPEQLLRYDVIEKADVIVIPSGEFIRVKYGVELLQKGYAKKIFSPGDAPYNIKYLQREISKIRNTSFSYVSFSDSTYQDATNTREFILKNPIHTLLLVTSPYHSKRTYWIFRRVLPRSVKIISATVPQLESDFDIKLAHTPGTWEYGISRLEQKKFLGYYFKYGWRIF
ncbi:MAG: YdcF family protein [Candidatus Margulisiibacteriota bacterium]